MKRQIILSAAALLLLCASCTKEKNCRCQILNSQKTRIITIKKGSCENISYAQYKDDLDTIHVDSVVCSDYIFKADSNIIYNK